MSKHGTASVFEISQFVTVSNAVTVALPKALDGIDPKHAISCVQDRGEVLERHIRRFFDPSANELKILRPRYIVPIPQVPTNYDQSWDQAINTAGPDTGADWDIRKVGHLYVAKRKGIVLTDVTLVNFGEDVESEQVLEFGREHRLGRVMDPRECFALGTHRPNLHRDLGVDALAVVSLEKREFRGKPHVPCLWWGAARRGADVHWFGSRWLPGGWFGFVRES